MMILSVKSLLAASACVVVASFAPTSIRRTVPSLLFGSRESVFEEVDLPDFDSVFEKIQQVSPLARSIIDNGSSAATDGELKNGLSLCHETHQNSHLFSSLTLKQIKSCDGKLWNQTKRNRSSKFKSWTALVAFQHPSFDSVQNWKDLALENFSVVTSLISTRDGNGMRRLKMYTSYMPSKI